MLGYGGSGFVGSRLIQILQQHGWQVRALARSDEALRTVRALGAEPVRGSLEDRASLIAAAQGCSVVFHVAAHFRLWGDWAEFERSNVQVGCGSSRNGDLEPMFGVNEALPRQERDWAPYSASKARSETLVLAANRPGVFETVVVRPPMIWGPNMPTLDHMIETVKAGQFRWVGGGSQAMSTAHVDNVCLALELAAEKGPGGEAYFVSDGNDSTLKNVISGLLQTRGIAPPRSSAPLPVAWAMASVTEWVWRTFSRPGEPPMTRQMLRLIGAPFTLDIGKARRDLGYVPVISREQGLEAMRSS
ncbi:unnamed protein product, partial [Mesorhabditis spiculigera]